MALSTLVEQPSNAYSVRNLRDFIAFIEENHPEELLRISDEISPGSFEATAILANLEQRGLYPMVLFERPVNQLGQVSPFPCSPTSMLRAVVVPWRSAWRRIRNVSTSASNIRAAKRGAFRRRRLPAKWPP